MTLRHDDALRFCLEKQGRQPRVEKYDLQGGKSGNLGNLGTAKVPLIYQLHGSYDDARSMVLTENDLLDFLCKRRFGARQKDARSAARRGFESLARPGRVEIRRAVGSCAG
jgi:hypothetical protein